MSFSWSQIVPVLLLGVAGSFGHCLGMCGGFALAIGRGAQGVRGLVARHLAYQTGKALTYVFLAVVLAGGAGWLGNRGWFSTGQMVLCAIAGTVMLLYGVMQVTEWRPVGGWSRLLEPIPGCRALGLVAQQTGLLPAFFTGWLNGFLPCGLVLAALAYLASTGSVTTAAVGAAAFGFATFPGLFALGLAARAWNPRWRRVLVRATGVLLILFGLVTLLRGFPVGRQWLMEHVVPHVPGVVQEWCGF